MRTLKLAISLVALTLGAALFTSAQAEICVVLDEANDTLAQNEKKGALALARGSFENAGEKVVEAPCDNQYKISNVRMGRSIIAKVGGPKGNRTASATRIESLGDVYDQMIRSLIMGEKYDDTAGNAITRKNVTVKQAAPLRASADAMGYVTVGPGFISGVDADEIPISIGGGYRYELDSFAIDLSTNLVWATGDSSGGASWFGQIGGLYFFDPTANNSLYAGGSLGWGAIVVNSDEEGEDEAGAIFDFDPYAGSGLHARLNAGYALLRASNIRLFFELNATLPFYNLTREIGDKTESQYTPVFGLSIGVGWSRGNSLTVRRL